MEDNQLFLFDIDQTEKPPTQVESASIACAENTQPPMRDPNVIYSDDSDYVKFLKRIFYYKEGKLYWRFNRKNKITKDRVAGTFKTKDYPMVRLTVKGKAVSILTHIIVYKMHYGEYDDSEFIVEHKGGDKLNCAIENLRLGTRSQNGSNIPRKRGELHGVYFESKGKKNWRAKIKANKKQYIKMFNTKAEAIRWRKMMEEKLHGEFKAREVDQAPGQPG